MTEEKIKTLEHQIQHILQYRMILERNMSYLKRTTDMLILENKHLKKQVETSNEKIQELEVQISNLELARFRN